MQRTIRLLTGVAWLAALGLHAQPPAGEMRRVVVGEQFRKGGLYRLLFGDNYRGLWTTPVELPVLDLRTYAGGLTPVRRVGHGQTQALALKGKNGVSYTFRPIVKDPIALVPEDLRETLAVGFVRDQMSSQHPAGHVVVPPLMEAVGLLHNTPELVILPDDPALLEFRDDFKDTVGDIEEFVGQQGFGGSLETVGGEEAWKRLDESPAFRIDARAYLRARLVDHLVGDWDRHRGQWKFARLPDTELWQPIPEDRDQAFVRFGGFAIAQVRGALPFLVSFGPGYPSLDALTFDSWDVDRRLLTGLEREDWLAAAAEVRAKLTDEVLARAVRRLPQAYFEQEGAALEAALRARRDALETHAERFYRFMARQVDVRGTQQAERARITRFEGGDVEVALGLKGAGAPYYRRLFRRGETDEVRLYLLGGDDEAVTSGPRGGVTVRVMGGAGDDRVDDGATGGLRVFDAAGDNQVVAGPGTRVDRKPWDPPPGNPRADWVPARDWGRRTIAPLVRLSGATDIGLLVDVGLLSTGYGFRKQPYADRQRVRLGYATSHDDFRAEYLGEFRRENAPAYFTLHARASQIDILRFYGFGNASSDDDPRGDDFYRVEQDHLSLAPALVVPLGPRSKLSIGPLLRYAATEDVDAEFLGVAQPYGVGPFWQTGLRAELDLDARDRVGLPSRGVLLTAGGSYHPALLDVEESFGEVHGALTAYLGTRLPLEPTLALHAGGKRVWGRYPFHEAAFLGGGNSLRGLRSQRYAGDAVLYGSAELRLSLADAFLLVPTEIGVFVLADVGRVYLEGEDSDRWHRGFGGGVYFASPERRSALSIAVARSEGRLGLYVRTGIGF